MVATLGDLELRCGSLADDPVNQAMLEGDPPRPPSRKDTPQRFRLADARECSPLDVVDESVDPLRDLGVSFAEPAIVLSG